MNVPRSRLFKIIASYTENQRALKADDSKRASKKIEDKVTISKDAEKFSKAIEVALKSDDVRMEKVEEIKAKVKSGAYNVDGKLVADKIIEECSMNKLI